MPGTDLVDLPVHSGRPSIIDLHPIHADIAVAGVGVLGEDGRQRDEAPAIVRPALEDWQIVQGKISARLVNDLLAGGGADVARFGVDDINAIAEERESFLQSRRWLGLHEELHLVGELVDFFKSESHGHAAARAHGVDGEREGGLLAVDCRLFKEEGLSTTRRFHLAIGEFRDLEFRGDRRGDPAEFAGRFQSFAERSEGRMGHFEEKYS